MKTDDELIAEFMGGKLCSMYIKDVGNILAYEFDNGDDTERYAIVTLKYQLSWDWLKPVVDKIDRIMPSINIPDDLESLKDGTHGSEKYIDVTALPLATPIDEAYNSVVEFIKWYNQKKP